MHVNWLLHLGRALFLGKRHNSSTCFRKDSRQFFFSILDFILALSSGVIGFSVRVSYDEQKAYHKRIQKRLRLGLVRCQSFYFFGLFANICAIPMSRISLLPSQLNGMVMHDPLDHRIKCRFDIDEQKNNTKFLAIGFEKRWKKNRKKIVFANHFARVNRAINTSDSKQANS